MNSDTQPIFKREWKDAAFAFLAVSALMGGIALFDKLVNPQTDVSSILYLVLPLTAGLMLFSFVKLKVITILSLLTSIIFLVVSFLTKEHDPKLSSMSVLSAFFALAGAIVPTLFSQTQTFLYDRGFRGTGVYIDGVATGGDWGSGDCGGDGGGGDCGS